MSGGGKDKKTKQTMKLPAWYEEGAKNAIEQGKKVAEGGYIPYIGADVAAMAPQTLAGLQGIDAMSAAFGMPTSGGASYLPEAQDFGGGIKGYSSFPAFEESMNALKAKYPAAYDYLSQFSKLGGGLPGLSPNPSQATPMQGATDPQFNALIDLIKNMGGVK